jgi:tagatose-1,6-bisphosphate aldolase non-catalytic subunit AgaZ/GatZ
MSAATKLHAIVRDNRLGLSRALPSWCMAHSDTLTAIFKAHGDGEDPILIEATCNQVNQEGPESWRSYVHAGPKERVDRLFGLSDRVRYYWRNQDLAAAVNDLKSRVDFADIAPGLVSQFAGALDDSVGTHSLFERLVQSRVGAVVARYRAASRRVEHTADFKSVTAAMRADFL